MQRDQARTPNEGRAFVEYVHREHHAMIVATARRYAGAAHADDVASRVYEKLLQGRLPDPTRPLEPWLRRVVRNQAIDHVRCFRPHEQLDLEPAAHGDISDRVVNRIIVRDALSRLAPVERDAVMAEIVGRTPGEVGSEHGRTAHAVHNLASRARRQLRALLEPAMLPVWTLLAWLRRTLHRVDQPTMQYAVDAVVIAALAFGVGLHSSTPGVSAPSPASTVAVAMREPKPIRAASGSRPIELVRADVSPPGSVDTKSPTGARVEIDQREGAATPRQIVINDPDVETPIGSSGSETQLNCTHSFETVKPPRNDDLYSLC